MRAAGLLLLIGVAAALRLWGVAEWSLDGDEFYAWRDVGWLLDGTRVAPSIRSHPVGYLGIAACARVLGMTELGLRLFPVTLGLAAVPLAVLMRRDVVPAAVGWVAAGLAALSPWLLYHAQTARFYAPLLFFAMLATLWLLPGKGCRPWLGGLAAALAALCHPSGLILVAGLGSARLLDREGRRWLLRALPVAVVVGAGILLLNRGATVELVERALAWRGLAGYDAAHLVAGLGYNTHGLGLALLVGLVAVWREREPSGRTLIGLALVGPAVLLLLSLTGVSVHQRYFMAAMPAWLLLGGFGLTLAWRALISGSWLGIGRWAGALVLLVTVAVPVPALLAHLEDGNRHPWKAAAAGLAKLVRPEHILVSDEHALLELYLCRHPDFADSHVFEAPVTEARKLRSFARNRLECWVLLKASKLDGSYGEVFMAWLDEHFEEVDRWGVAPPRWTRHDNRLILYRRRAR